MEMLRKALSALPLPVLLLACVTLGLAPYAPEPHLVEKLRMLAAGELRRGVDWFDLALHGAPWVLLGLRLALVRRRG